MNFNTTNLVSRIEARAALPEGRYNSTEILDMASRTLISEVVPVVRSAHQEYYVTRTSTPTVANQSSYSLPYRAIGQGLRETKLERNGRWIDLPNVELENIDLNINGIPEYSYIENNKLIVWPVPQDTDSNIIIWYYRKPSTLVDTTEGFPISSIDTNTGEVTLTGEPSWTTANTIDVISHQSGYTVRATDQVITDITTNVVTFSSLPTNISVGNYLCLSEETIFPEIPDEAQEILVCLTGANLLFDMGDRENAGLLRQNGERLAVAYVSMINPRITGAPKPLSTPMI